MEKEETVSKADSTPLSHRVINIMSPPAGPLPLSIVMFLGDFSSLCCIEIWGVFWQIVYRSLSKTVGQDERSRTLSGFVYIYFPVPSRIGWSPGQAGEGMPPGHKWACPMVTFCGFFFDNLEFSAVRLPLCSCLPLWTRNTSDELALCLQGTHIWGGCKQTAHGLPALGGFNQNGCSGSTPPPLPFLHPFQLERS